MSNAKWFFTCTDTSGKQQYFTVSAPDKITATRKGRERAARNAAGDLTRWECNLKRA